MSGFFSHSEHCGRFSFTLCRFQIAAKLRLRETATYASERTCRTRLADIGIRKTRTLPVVSGIPESSANFQRFHFRSYWLIMLLVEEIRFGSTAFRTTHCPNTTHTDRPSYVFNRILFPNVEPIL